jgi:hypothetical protein
VGNVQGDYSGGRTPAPGWGLRGEAAPRAAAAGLTVRVLWLLPEDLWALLPLPLRDGVANRPGSALQLASPLGPGGVRAGNGNLDALLAHGNVKEQQKIKK